MPEPSIASASPASDRGLLVWAALWFGGFAVSAAMAAAGIGFHSSNSAFVFLLGRDLVFAALGLLAWRRLPALPVSRTAAGITLDRASALLALVLLGAYVVVALRHGTSAGSSPLLIETLQPRMPLRILSLVLFQQMVTTWYLLDVARLRFGDQTGLALTVVLFASSHAVSPLLGAPVALALLLVVLAAAGMLAWGLMRMWYGARVAPICLHVSFYLGAALAYALW